MSLPPELLDALDNELDAVPPREVGAAAAVLSARYREEHGRTEIPPLRSRGEVMAYAAFRFPATYAAILGALEAVAAVRPEFRPRSLLDVGGGPGTAAWAATGLWPEIEDIVVVDRDERMIYLGRALAKHSASSALQSARWERADARDMHDLPEADLVVAAYMLGEAPDDDRAPLTERLWAHTSDVFLLIEPGTPRGFAIVQTASTVLQKSGAVQVAPFPYEWTCVEHERDWCHFSQRVSRTRLHRAVKDAALSYEDEKYSYVAVSRVPAEPIAARVVRRPEIHSGHIRFTLCTASGIQRIVVTRKNKAAWRRAKDLRWGSAIGVGEAELFGISTDHTASSPLADDATQRPPPSFP